MAACRCCIRLQRQQNMSSEQQQRHSAAGPVAANRRAIVLCHPSIQPKQSDRIPPASTCASCCSQSRCAAFRFFTTIHLSIQSTSFPRRPLLCTALHCTALHRSALLPSLVRCSADCEHSLALVSPVCSFSACMGICSAAPSDRSRLFFCRLPSCRCRCLHTHPIHFPLLNPPSRAGRLSPRPVEFLRCIAFQLLHFFPSCHCGPHSSTRSSFIFHLRSSIWLFDMLGCNITAFDKSS